MAVITLKGIETHTDGDFPRVGSKAPDFTLTNTDLQDLSLQHFAGHRKLLSIFPSVDTPVCALSTKHFNDYARENPEVVMLMVSADLPFAQARFCGNEGLENVVTLSTLRSQFARDYGVLIEDGPMAGLCARAVVVIDENNNVVHAQLVGEIADEPDYEAAIRALG